ncbi:hypothetical protein YC2023_059449 [Brassica napus]|uniref:Uncharacterized protein n=2 Tax=Brassica oleracea TaxID=3712 RepID=A0A0D3CEN0_BRAOL|nr:unnamed protein product [Brassica oleracea]
MQNDNTLIKILSTTSDSRSTRVFTSSFYILATLNGSHLLCNKTCSSRFTLYLTLPCLSKYDHDLIIH